MCRCSIPNVFVHFLSKLKQFACLCCTFGLNCSNMHDFVVLLVAAEAIRMTLLYCGLTCNNMHDFLLLLGKGAMMSQQCA